MNIGIIGYGSIARKHVQALKKISLQTCIYALRSKKDEKEKVDVINIFSWNEFNSIDLDFAIVSNPTNLHLETINKLMESQIPLFIEKPIFSNIGNEEQKLVKQCMEKDITTYVACNLRFLDCIKYIKSYTKQKRINEVNVYCGSYLPDWRPNVDFRKTYSANKDLGGGVHLDLIHELDYIFWIFGEPKKTESFFSSKSSLKINATDYANFLWHYESFNANVVLNFYRRDSKRTMEIVFDDETLTIDLLKNKVSRNDEIIFSSKQEIIDTYKKQMEFFVDSVIGKGERFNTIEEAYKILNLCLTK